MNDRLEEFYRYLKGKRVAMLGLGVSNVPLIETFVRHGAKVTARDRRSREALGELADQLEQTGASLILGDGYLRDLDEDIIFRTPGIKYTLPQLDAARARGSAVTSEMEVFFDLCPCRTIGVTGSAGKTTTTTVISEILKKSGRTVHLGGNIGRPLLPEIERVSPRDVAVVELSSFQLISMRRSPDIAVLTNIHPNHLDMHRDMREYIDAKRNIYQHQNAFGRLVLNLDCDTTAPFASEARGSCFLFSRKQRVKFGSFAENGVLYYSDGAAATEVMRADEIKIPGNHNVENYLAVISALWGLVPPEEIRDVARTFPGVEHRCEFVREFEGVRYYNDSIATSPDRTIAGLEAFARKVILIAGGSDKNIPYDPIGPAAVKWVKRLVLLGKTADKIEAAVRRAPGFDEKALPVDRVSSLEEAVRNAKKHAAPGDIVFLSPASASFDMFQNFEQRGEQFKEVVNHM